MPEKDTYRRFEIHSSDAIYGAHLDTGSADFIQSSFMPPTSTGAAVLRVLIGLPCVHSRD